eukprot:m.313101 g.313101  ORF g.313101 m.313101 type:complete len:82 (+) comp349458_c0_seq1:3-248(+)
MLKTWALNPKGRPTFKELVTFIKKAIEQSDKMDREAIDSQSEETEIGSSEYHQKSLLSTQDSGLVFSSAPQESGTSDFTTQ